MENPIFVVYKHLEAFIKFRGLKTDHKFVTSAEIDEDNKDNLMDNVLSNGYMEIKCDGVNIIIIHYSSRYSLNTPELKKLMAKVEASEEFKNKKLNELIFIVSNEFPEVKRLRDEMQKKKDEYGKSGIYMRVCPYRMFIMEFPKKSGIAKSRIMTSEEKKSHLEYHRKNKIDLKTVDESADPMIVWLGAKKDDFIHYDVISDTVGISPTVRRVV